MPILLAAGGDVSAWHQFVQYCLIGLTNGSLIALIALGYTMVYGIIGLINFAHGDLFMLGAFLSLTIVTACASLGMASGGGEAVAIVLALVAAPILKEKARAEELLPVVLLAALVIARVVFAGS